LSRQFRRRNRPEQRSVLTQIRVSQAQSQWPADVNKRTASPFKKIDDGAADADLGCIHPKAATTEPYLANYGYINLFDPLTRVPGLGMCRFSALAKYAMRRGFKAGSTRPSRSCGITVPDIINAGQSIEHGESRRPGRQRTNSKRTKFTYTVRAQGRTANARRNLAR